MTKLKLGMPHLNYHGLDQVWLSKHLGNQHWEMLSKGPAKTKDNERLYASFFCASINFNQGQHLYQEGDDVEFDSKIFKFNGKIYRSMHTISNNNNTTTAIFDSIFVKKDLNSHALIKDEPDAGNINDIAKIDRVFIDEHKKLKKELRESNITEELVELPFNPETYFNAVKILYFANYLNLVAQCEYQCIPELKQPIKDLTIYYFSNISAGDRVYGITTVDGATYTTKLYANNKAIAVCTINR